MGVVVPTVLKAVRQRGEIVDDADRAEMAKAVIAIIEGGYLVCASRATSARGGPP
jgi:hypothetical protein